MGICAAIFTRFRGLLIAIAVTAEKPGAFSTSVYGRRLALALALAAALTVPSLATLWVWTPSGADVQARVDSSVRLHGGRVLGPDEVPPRLAEAVVAIEDERFYQHHGI